MRKLVTRNAFTRFSGLPARRARVQLGSRVGEERGPLSGSYSEREEETHERAGRASVVGGSDQANVAAWGPHPAVRRGSSLLRCWDGWRRRVLPVPVRSEPTTGRLVADRGHVRHARGIDPVVIELEKRANSDRIVQCFVRPARAPHGVRVGRADGSRIRHHLPYKGVERSILVRDRRRVEILQDRLD